MVVKYMRFVPKTHLRRLSSHYTDNARIIRICVKQQVHHIVVHGDEYTYLFHCSDEEIIDELPGIPEGNWSVMDIKELPGQDVMECTIRPTEMPDFELPGSLPRIDVTQLGGSTTATIRPGVFDVRWEGQPAIAKVACTMADLDRLGHELWAYLKVESYAGRYPQRATPKVLGYLTENGRDVGILLEKVEGRPAGPEDLFTCMVLLQRLHHKGVMHGNLSRRSFIIDPENRGRMCLISLEHAGEYHPLPASAEMDSLRGALAQELGDE